MLRDAFPILTAYQQAGKPTIDLLPWGSYENWSEAVRAPLVWAGLHDPALAQREMQEEGDEEGEGMALLAEIWERFDPQHAGVTTKDFIREINGPTACQENKDPETAKRILEDAETAKHILEDFCGKVDTSFWGICLKRYKDRPFKGRIFKKTGETNRYAKWAAGSPSTFLRQPKPTHSTRQTHYELTVNAVGSATREFCREPGEEG